MNTLEELYSISSKIIDKYSNLISLPSNTISTIAYQELINEIKDLVYEEYKIVHSMSKIDITISLEKIKLLNHTYNKKVIDRVTTRILDYREVIKNNTVSTSVLDIKTIPQDMEFSTYDVIISMIDIETIKRIKEKIYSLVISCETDRKFVIALKEQLRLSKYDFLFSGLTSEIVALYHETNIDNIPYIDINKIKSLKEININNKINEAITVYTRKILNTLSNTVLYNNPKDAFHYLTLVVGLEVLITYMDKALLNEVYRYCSNTNNNYIENIKKLIRKKMEENQE